MDDMCEFEFQINEGYIKRVKSDSNITLQKVTLNQN